MCSISGGFSFSDSETLDPKFLKFLILSGEDRGRDSFGISYPLIDKVDKFIGKPSFTEFNVLDKQTIVLNNNRAEPTTEYVRNKTLNDVQPFTVSTVTVAHNGTIANDKEIRTKFSLPEEDTSIDSFVLASLFFHAWDGVSEQRLVELLTQEIVGSFSLAIFDKRNPDVLWLAVNYKPLTLIYRESETDNSMYFTSLEEYTGIDHYSLDIKSKIIQVKPYTLLKIAKDKTITRYSLYPEKIENVNVKKKALIIASGGLDSTVAASWAKAQGYSIELLHFVYGCKASLKEQTHIKQIGEFLNCPVTKIHADFFKDVIKHSRLFGEEETLMLEEGGKKSAELAHEWVPARNLIFMSIAAGYAEAHKFDFIVLGGNLEESGCILNVKENMVLMFDGTKKMPKDVNVGDELLSWNEITKKVEPTVVIQKFTPVHKKYLKINYKIYQDMVGCLKTTSFLVSEEHPFYVEGTGWVEAGKLNPNDILKSLHFHGRLIIESIKTIEKEVQTYNYACEPNNNFFIGNSGALVHNSYPDNEYIFQKKFDEILPFSLNVNEQVKVLTPVANLMKHEIVKLGLSLGAPLHLTWSCYTDQEIPCGTCGPDFMRKIAFKMNGIKDMQDKNQEDPFWEGCDTVTLSDGFWKSSAKTPYYL